MLFFMRNFLQLSASLFYVIPFDILFPFFYTQLLTTFLSLKPLVYNSADGTTFMRLTGWRQLYLFDIKKDKAPHITVL